MKKPARCERALVGRRMKAGELFFGERKTRWLKFEVGMVSAGDGATVSGDLNADDDFVADAERLIDEISKLADRLAIADDVCFGAHEVTRLR